MRFSSFAMGSMLLLALAACNSTYSGVTATGGKPMGAASTAPGAASKEPEPANSLPAGDAISGPVTNRVGNVGTTRY